MTYKVKLKQFEGPFDLLIYLIEHAQMSIYDIRVSEITTQYIAYIEQMKEQDVAVGGEFMVLAAMLIELKSRMLLPRPQTAAGAEEEDPRKELMQKLLEYKQFKAAAEQLSAQQEWMQRIYVKPQEDLSAYQKEPDEILSMDLTQFVKAFQMFLIKKQRLEEVRKTYARVERQRMTIENRIEQLKACFLKKNQLTFRELLQGSVSRYNVVITFMSLLELLKQHAVTAVQETRYGEITVALAGPAQAGLTEEWEEGPEEELPQQGNGQRGEYEQQGNN